MVLPFIQGMYFSVAKIIFWKVEHIQITDMHHQAHRYFSLIGIGNLINKIFPNVLVVSYLQNLANNTQEV